MAILDTPDSPTSHTAAPSKDSVFFLVSIAFCAAVVASGLLVAPLIAGQLITELGLTVQQVGLVISAELAGLSLASLPALFWLNRYSWHRVVYISLCLVIIGNITSTFADTFTLLVIIRFVTALAAGSVMLITMQAAAKARNTQLAYSCWLIGQLIFGAIALVVLPSLFANYGLDIFYYLIAGISTGLFFVVKGLPSSADTIETSTDTSSKIPLAGFIGLAGVFFFYVSIGGVWTYIERIGISISFAPQSIGSILGVATLAGILGAALAPVLSKYLKPVLGVTLGTGLLTLAIIMLKLNDSQSAYIGSAILFKFTWTFTIPFVLTILARLDKRGLLITSCNVLIGAGIAIGPLVAAAVIQGESNYGIMLTTMAIASVLAILALGYSAVNKANV